MMIMTAYLLIEAEWRIYASEAYVAIGSDDDVSPVRHRAMIRSNDDLSLTGPLGTNFCEIWRYNYLMRKIIWKYHLQNVDHFAWIPKVLRDLAGLRQFIWTKPPGAPLAIRD